MHVKCNLIVFRMRMLDSLSNTSLFAILEHIRHNFTHFLQLARHRQMALAEKAVDVLVRKETPI